MTSKILRAAFVIEVQAVRPEMSAVRIDVGAGSVELSHLRYCLSASPESPLDEIAIIRRRPNTKRVRNFMQGHAEIPRTTEINPTIVTRLRRRHAGIVVGREHLVERTVTVVL